MLTSVATHQINARLLSQAVFIVISKGFLKLLTIKINSKIRRFDRAVRSSGSSDLNL